VDEIYSRHMLEHLDPNDARRALRAWAHVLRPGGLLHLIMPDLEFHCRQFLGLTRSDFPDQHDHAMAGFFGWRCEDRGGDREDAHRWGYTFDSLARELAAASFIQIERVTAGPDSAPWHLNVTARKPVG
jgi:predicted SAM-dependent methyltransferase